MTRHRKPERVRCPPLTCDDSRRFEGRAYRTRDGLRVRVEVEWDRWGCASYGGTWLADLTESCPELCDALSESCELPLFDQRVYVHQPFGTLHVKPDTLIDLLQGNQHARLPKHVLARLLTSWDRVHDRAGDLIDRELNAAATIRVTVSAKTHGRVVVLAQRELSGIFDTGGSVARGFERATIMEARAERECAVGQAEA